MKKTDNATERQARAILNFTQRADVPDFISNAVMLAIEGAAIANNLPRPYMKDTDTVETEAPKVAAVLTAAGELFSLSSALEATGRGILSESREPTQDATPGHDEGARLTPQEAAALVRGWVYSFFDEDEKAGDLLLLLRSICYTPQMLDRENIVMAVESILIAAAPCASEALRSVMTQRLAVAHSLLKEGGSQ